MEIVARGVRNTVGFDWHPVTKELWFTDNGRDWAGNAGPEDELNRIPKGRRARTSASRTATPTALPIRTSSARILRRRDHAGRADRTAFRRARHQVLHRQHVPEEYQNVAFIARHGSWNREKKYGYDVVVAKTAGGKAKIEPFMTGLLDEKKRLLRPAGLRAPDEGRLAAGLRRAQRRDLSHHATASAADREPVDADVMRHRLQNGGGRWPSGWRPLCSARRPALARATFARAAALRRLPRRGRQFQDGENSVARRPAGILHPQPAFPDARRRAQSRGDGADRQGSEGRRADKLSEHYAKLPPKRSDEPVDPALAKRGAEIARNGVAGPAICRASPDRSRCRGWPSSASTI